MARGKPAVWSTLLGLPFVAGGALVSVTDPSESVPATTGIPIATFGLFVVALGVYVHFVAAPDPPNMRRGERILETRAPAQRAAVAKTVAGLLGLCVAGYLLFFTFLPYVYPTVAFVTGLYYFSTGIHAYWTNTLTTYYLTNRRLIKEYRFVSLVRQELPFEKVRGVEERRSVWEVLAGLGNVRVASGEGRTLEVVVRNIAAPTEFADEVRELL